MDRSAGRSVAAEAGAAMTKTTKFIRTELRVIAGGALLYLFLSDVHTVDGLAMLAALLLACAAQLVWERVEVDRRHVAQEAVKSSQAHAEFLGLAWVDGNGSMHQDQVLRALPKVEHADTSKDQ
jgi:hypothetical protein